MTDHTTHRHAPHDAAGFIPCLEKSLDGAELLSAADEAVRLNPANRPAIVSHLQTNGRDFSHAEIAILIGRRWHTNGVRLSVSFMDGPSTALRAKILQHMNVWGDSANVEFTETAGSGQVRITRQEEGYWSYLGTDILSIAADQPTMSLEGFTENTADSEFCRVVRHETGHTLGFPHEHMRRELVSRLDPTATIAYFQARYGWDADRTRRQVLTPIEDRLITGTPPDQDSIMCYQLPATLTIDHLPIRGGTDLDPTDIAFAASCYPRTLVN